MIMTIAIMSVAFSSCSKDDEPDGGSMSGWVKIDGKTYDFKYFYGMTSDGGYGYGITGFSKNPYKLDQNTKVNLCSIDFYIQPNGSWIPKDPTTGELYFDIEVDLDVIPETGSDGGATYTTWDSEGLDGVSITKNGNKFVIDGKSVKVKYNPNGNYVGSNSPTTKIDFHFEGKPEFIEYDED